MKKHTILIGLLIIVAVFVLYFKNPQKPENPQNSSQIIEPLNIEKDKNSSTEKEKKEQIKTTSKQDLEQQTPESFTENNPKEDSEVDYIMAYRDWQYFKNCYTDVEDFHNNKDPLQTLAERFQYNPRESQNEPTPQQNIYYQYHVDVCKSLIDDENDDYYQIMSKLEQRFQRIQPNTPEAKQLEHAIKLVEQHHQFVTQYNNSFSTEFNIPATEVNMINTQIEQLNQQLYEVYESSGYLDHDDMMQLREDEKQQIQNLLNQISELKQALDESKYINFTQADVARKTMYGHRNSMEDYLHSVTSPDAFLVLAAEVYKIDLLYEEPQVIQLLKQKTGIKDSLYINVLNGVVLPLVACSMNYPCDAESEYILSYCLGLKDSMFNEACGSNLEDFYFSHYIGSNQLTDVYAYFNFLVERYAK
ncbi:MAG TPA: hypothetical protein PK055_09335 [Gammaproteobacteria bacterium]|nr:hypothetical protein [Xanthomonadales bacterium]MCB1594458.1 hypothetical protein [Xanthomonadales bacterium]HOP22198.1 hypothetical protein [Gammaproteobacteria bacterium]HPI96493.1 hypothetical protein [Gammaproteobacteria bacterium]HPQ87847.1 hypothetical protein [Gammaproteobacteria bacterium]